MIGKRLLSLDRYEASRLALLGLCLVFLLGSSCAKREVVRQPELEPYAGPVTVEALKSSIGFRDVKTIKALADAEIYKNGEPAGSFSGVFGYKAPDSLKTSFFGPFGLTVMEVLITRDLLQVSLPSKNVLYQMNSPEISFSALVNLSGRYEMQEEDDLYALYVYNNPDRSAGLVMKYLFDRTYLLNRRIIVYRDSTETVMIGFDRFNGKVPEKMKVSFNNGMDMEMELRESEYDTDIPDGYFAEIERLDKKILPLQELLRRFDPRR